MADSATTGEAPPKPAKRSFFKKPSWATAETKSESPQTPIDVFSHSSESFADIIAEQERRKKAKLRKQQEAQKQKENESRESKRRRISNKEEENQHSLSLESSRRRSSKDRSRTPHDLTTASKSSPKSARLRTNSQSLSARYDEAVKMSTPPKKQSVVIDLSDGSDSSDDDLYKPPTPNGVIVPNIQSAHVPQDEDEQEDDPEFRALAAKAREKRRLQELGAAKPPTSNVLSRTSPETFSRSTFAASPPAPDPTVKIFISSAIPDTVPLLVSRKLSQRLQEVRKAWCGRQNFSEDMADSVFFTYRNRRLWDVTTCKSLGIEVDSSGNIRQKDDFDLYSENDGKIHLEAVTPEIWEENKRQAGEERTEEPEEEEREVVEEPSPAEVQRIRLFLKARGYEDFRLQVNPTSTFESIAHAYRVRQKIPSDKSIFLMFDGDRLDPVDTMQDSEIEDMDSIEVHIK